MNMHAETKKTETKSLWIEGRNPDMSLPANVDNLISSLERAQEALGPVESGQNFLKLNQTGSWTYGADKIVVDIDSVWAVNPNSFATGYICWEGGAPVGNEMALITEEPIDKHSLPNHNAAWQSQVCIQLVCVSGPDEGIEVVYAASTDGGKKGFRSLLDEVLAKARSGSTSIVPFVTLTTKSYPRKASGNTVYTPVFSITDWSTMDGETKISTETPEPEIEEEKPARRRQRRTA